MKYISVLLIILGSIPVLAAPITPNAALNRLQSRNTSPIKGKLLTQQYRISKIITDSSGINTIYLFDSKDGFVVTPADDFFPAMLGYGEGKMYDSAGNLPVGFREWLQYMSRRISETSKGDNTVNTAPSVGEAIALLCSTSWGQEEPFNLECPEYYGEKCLSGCVATAMAQVMKYHKWPPQGKGELTYHAEKIGANIYTDFSQYTLDWDNMLDDYSESSVTEIQKKSVANLLRAVGGSVRMNYSPTASGADVNDATQALLKYWDYSDDIRYMRRGWFTLQDWSQILYDALKNYGPILYGGFSISSAHAFVCDGYDGNGMFHFNWGWDGKADGYFAIDFLNPIVEDQPRKTGYNSGQCAVLNILPRSQENPGKPTYAVWLDSYYIEPASKYGDDIPYILHPGDSFKMRGECTNYGPFAIPAGSKFATIFTSLYDKTSIPSNIVGLTSDLQVYGSFDSELKTVPEGLSDGLYLMNNDIYINPSGWGHSILMAGSTSYCASVENNGSDIRFIESLCVPQIEESDIPDKLTLDSTIKMHAIIRNTSSGIINRPIRVELIQDGIVKGWSPWFNASFGPEETIDLDISVDNLNWKDETFSHAGEYILCLSMRNPFGGIWIPMGEGKKVTVSDSANIDSIRLDNILQDAMYDLYGRKVIDNVNSLPSGIYIQLNNGVASKIAIP